MTKSSGRKKSKQQKARKEAHPFSTKNKSATKSPRSIWERTRDHPFFWAIGTIATFLAIFAPIYDSLREPEIQHSAAQIADPFSVRFPLHNPSFIFSMADTKLNCYLKKVEFERNNIVTDSSISDGTMATIHPNKTIEYGCPFNRIFAGFGQAIRATITIEAEYKTLGIKRVTKSELFNWDSVSHQWTEGEVVN